jgi:hypothetical protein
VDTTIIEKMDKGVKWIIWGLCVLGFGLIVNLAMAALIQATIAGLIVYSTMMWWWETVGLFCTLLCTIAGIGLTVVGLRMLVRN